MTTKDPWWWALLGVIVLVAVMQKFLPRYEWRTVPQAGSVTIITYDRWTGRMQRAVYDDKGALNVMGVYTPF
jgi:hypothetical protein